MVETVPSPVTRAALYACFLPRGGVGRCGFAGAVAAMLVALAAPVWATTVVSKDFAALCGQADMIFAGTVTAVESRWVDGTRQAIETLVTFGDLTWVRGEADETVTLRFAGGEVDGIREEIAGMPSFAVGERRVIFARDGIYVSPLVGFDQGALAVVEGPGGPEVTAPPPGARASMVLHLGDAPPPVVSPEPLDWFLERVRRQLGAGGARK